MLKANCKEFHIMFLIIGLKKKLRNKIFLKVQVVKNFIKEKHISE